MRFSSAAAAAAAIVGVASADLPVHCLHEDAVGEWTLLLDAGGGDETRTCGHEMPDRVMTMVDARVGFSSTHYEGGSQIRVALSEPNAATRLSDGAKGEWTMVYDEGFEIRFPDRRFFTFFKYVPRVDDPTPERMEDFDSLCAETYTGWYHDDRASRGSWGCFIAKKAGGAAVRSARFSHDNIVDPRYAGGFKERSVDLRDDDADADADTDAAADEGGRRADERNDGPSALSSMAQAVSASPLASRLFEGDGADLFAQDSQFIELHNSGAAVGSAGDSDEIDEDGEPRWFARSYPEFDGRTKSRMRRMLGHQRFSKDMGPYQRARPAAPSLSSFAQLEEGADLPESVNWATADDGKYATEVVSQGDCGSCYAIAAADVATMRLRIATGGRDRTKLSPLHAMACSGYNQGCDGGYPFLMGKHGSDVGFVPEECAPYSDSSEMSCDRGCLERGRVYRSVNYHYLGGYYGACSEVEMMRELAKGPVVVAFNAPSSLFYYARGIFKYPQRPPAEERHRVGYSRWEKTNHAVVCVGYGQTVNKRGKVVKYWVLKNSWGANWGEQGYFRLVRGRDELAAESMASAFDIDPATIPDQFRFAAEPQLAEASAAAPAQADESSAAPVYAHDGHHRRHHRSSSSAAGGDSTASIMGVDQGSRLLRGA